MALSNTRSKFRSFRKIDKSMPLHANIKMILKKIKDWARRELATVEQAPRVSTTKEHSPKHCYRVVFFSDLEYCRSDDPIIPIFFSLRAVSFLEFLQFFSVLYGKIIEMN